MAEIITAIDGTVAIVDIVAGESQYVFRGGDGEDARERDPVDLRSLISSGRLTVISTDDDVELMTFIDLTRELGEGEAMTAAIAIYRNATVVTDDRKAERVLASRNVPVRSTLGLIKDWSERHDITVAEIRSALIDLQQRGSYEPRRNHPLRLWWEGVLTAP